MIKIGKESYLFDNVYIKTTSTISGKLEQLGPVGGFIDKCFSNNYCNAKTWEKAEMELLDSAVKLVLEKGNLHHDDIDLFIGGDLNNQIVINNYVLKNYPFPLLGIYSACATLCEGLFIGATLIDNVNIDNVIVATSSHNATSERQFRNPTEYGGQKSLTTTFTTTGAGACLLTNKPTNIKITKATIGSIVDSTILDASDMGRAMAPACADTLIKHLSLPNATWKDERAASMRFIARCYKALNRLDETRMWLNKAITEAPYLRDAYVELALLEYEEKNWKKLSKIQLLRK